LALRDGSPLGWRILSKVRCRCPLHDQGCTWSGEYSEVAAHLTSSDSHVRSTMPRGGASGASTGGGNEKGGARATAEALKQQGNALFEARKYKEAISLYSKAIALAPGIATYYTNRASAWMRVGAFAEAEADARKAVAIDPCFGKAYLRLAKALVEQGKLGAAEEALASASQSGRAIYKDTGETVVVAAMHTDDIEPYYTIRFADGREKQTESSRLQLESPTAREQLAAEHERVSELYSLQRAAEAAFGAEEYSRAREIYATILQHTSARPLLLDAAKSEIALGTVDQALR
jgi:DnaJ family protein C protein 7